MEMYREFASVYDPLMSEVDYDAWAEYLIGFLKERLGQPPKAVAECACGTGEITLRLAKAGYAVTGLDLSPEMLSVAAEKARRAGRQIPFVRQDMRFLSLHKPVDAVIAACDGVNYLTSREQVQNFLNAAFRALKSGGILLFDVSSRYKLSTVLGDNTFGEDNGEQAYLWRNHYDNETKLIEMQLTFFRKKGTLYERFPETHIQRAHSEKELLNALTRAGFQDCVCFDAFTRSEPKADSERLQFAAYKA